MKLPERLARRKGQGFHSAIATSFAVEFSAFEEVILPQLSIGGATNVLLITDGRMATMALSDGSILPEALGREYLLHSPQAVDGVFHPKIILQVGRGGGRCMVSSANLTGAGLGGNVEVAVEIECGVEPGPEREIIQAAWRYLDAIVPQDEAAAREALSWARQRARWLDEPGNGNDVHSLDDGTAIAFLARPAGPGIGARFGGLIEGEPVERLVIVSPYWDGSLEALTSLEFTLKPATTTLLLDSARHEFPVDASMPAHREIIDISGWEASRFKHAKVIIAVTAEHDHVLSGSANCTIAALGNERFAGTNAEACIYRKLPRGAATAALGIDAWLLAEPLQVTELPAPVQTSPIPLDELQARAAGSFEVEGGRLNWRRPPSHWSAGSVVLTNSADEQIVEIDITRFSSDQERLSVWLGEETLKGASFCQVQSGDGISRRSYVVHRGVLRSRRREHAGGSVAKALSTFDHGNELELRMLRAFDELTKAELKGDDDGVSASPSTSQSNIPSEAPAPEIRYMTYDEFMAARAGRSRRGGRNDSAIAGTHFDIVRALLNRLSSSGVQSSGGSGPVDDSSWMDLGDEGGDLGDTVDTVLVEEVNEPLERPAPDLAAFDRAIREYTDGLSAEDRVFGAHDVLCLRLWITLILWEARCEKAPKGFPAVTDEKGWPRMVVRIVSAFFFGRNSPVSRLVVSADYADMPVDFFECWSTVLWALDSVIASVPDNPKTRDFLRRLPMLRAHVIVALGLTPTDFQGELMTNQRMGLDAELGTRLGVETVVPMNGLPLNPR